MLSEKRVTYSSSNSYATLNSPGDNTTHLWWAFHGLGYLSKYFLKYFKHLPPDEHYIIAPQAPSKYYLNDTYTHVGASWLTRVDIQYEIANLLNYLNAIYEEEKVASDVKVNVLGFSQGVSIALRWLARKKFDVDHLIIYAGGIPEELSAKDFEYLKPDARITVVYGSKDPFLTEEKLASEAIKLNKVFGQKAKILKFDGGHEITPEVLTQLLVK